MNPAWSWLLLCALIAALFVLLRRMAPTDVDHAPAAGVSAWSDNARSSSFLAELGPASTTWTTPQLYRAAHTTHSQSGRS